MRDARAVVLEVEGLGVSFKTEEGPRPVLRDVSLHVGPGEILGVVGESGSGKSVTSLAIMRLLGPEGTITAGTVRLDGEDLTALPAAAMTAVRGRRAAMVFQEPMTSLNPLMTVGFQVDEVLRRHLSLSARAARARTVELFAQVGIPAPAQRVDYYPHQLSGGQRQRVVIAMAIACRPRLLIADEPTTALDVTIQAQILVLVRELRDAEGSAVLLITHDMGVIAQVADRVVVMYAGEVVEEAPLRALLEAPKHPYTRLLLAATPGTRHRPPRLPTIPGTMPPPGATPPGCAFHPRCPVPLPVCREARPGLEGTGPRRLSRCWRRDEMPDLMPLGAERATDARASA